MRPFLAVSASLFALSSPLLHAQVQVITGHDEGDAGFWLGAIQPPAIDDAAQKATFKVVDGQPGGTPITVLNDGEIPKGEDDPKGSFFFADSSEGGRFSVDLGSVITVKSVDTYSWHGGGRAPQLYRLWAANGKDAAFDAAPKKGTDPKTVGWTLVATVDTRPKTGSVGGQYGVEVTNKQAGGLGDYQYLLFEVARTST
ncbi:MAG: basic secretory protein, partial [Akkermansiaceae bacterium]|nr:basic secretory protein [Akkermansiaceae bacterium]